MSKESSVLSLESVLTALDTPVGEDQLWALCYGAGRSLLELANTTSSSSSTSSDGINEEHASEQQQQQQQQQKEEEEEEEAAARLSGLPVLKTPADVLVSGRTVTLHTLNLQRDGVVTFEWGVGTRRRSQEEEDSDLEPFVADELRQVGQAAASGKEGVSLAAEATVISAADDGVVISTEKAHVFALGATLFKAADFLLEEDEEPELSGDLEALLTAMLDEEPDDRVSLAEVCAKCTEHVGVDALVGRLADLHSLAMSILDPSEGAGGGGGGNHGNSISGIGLSSSSASGGGGGGGGLGTVIGGGSNIRVGGAALGGGGEIRKMRQASGLMQELALAAAERDTVSGVQQPDIHAALMAGISGGIKLRDASKRRLAPVKNEQTPHEKLMAALQRPPSLRASARPITPPRQMMGTDSGAEGNGGGGGGGGGSDRIFSGRGDSGRRGSDTALAEKKNSGSGSSSSNSGSGSGRGSGSGGSGGSGSSMGGENGKERFALHADSIVETVDASGVKRKRISLNAGGLGSLRWDVSAQVQLAFATEAAMASEPVSSSLEESPPTSATTSGHDQGVNKSKGRSTATTALTVAAEGLSAAPASMSTLMPAVDEVSDAKSTASKALSGLDTSSQEGLEGRKGGGGGGGEGGGGGVPQQHSRRIPLKLLPMDLTEPDDPPPSYMNFEEFRHIRRTLSVAEMVDILDDDPALHDLLERRRVCGACRATRFSLLVRARECRVCLRAVCSKCSDRIQLPAHMVRGSPKGRGGGRDLERPVVICNSCRGCLGGVTFSSRR